MHTEARRFVEQEAVKLGARKGVVEFGSCNVNGTIRSVVMAEKWYGIDIRPGPDVDEVANAATWDRPEAVDCDTVICMECLEHSIDAPEIIANAYRVLEPDGVFIMTCAGPDRTPHSCNGNLNLGGEYYRNLSRDDVASMLIDAGFSDFFVMESPSECVSKGPRGDTYAVAYK